MQAARSSGSSSDGDARSRSRERRWSRAAGVACRSRKTRASSVADLEGEAAIIVYSLATPPSTFSGISKEEESRADSVTGKEVAREARGGPSWRSAMARDGARAQHRPDRASLYQEITDQIIAELEAGRLPWV